MYNKHTEQIPLINHQQESKKRDENTSSMIRTVKK